MVRPAPICATIMPTVTRIPRMHGLPPMTAAFCVIRVNSPTAITSLRVMLPESGHVWALPCAPRRGRACPGHLDCCRFVPYIRGRRDEPGDLVVSDFDATEIHLSTSGELAQQSPIARSPHPHRIHRRFARQHPGDVSRSRQTLIRLRGGTTYVTPPTASLRCRPL